MAEPIVVTETKPVEVSQPVVETPKVEAPKEDLITRVSKEKTPEVKQPENTFGLTNEDWDKVQSDPTLKKYYDSMHSDYQRKTQTIAEQRKEIERTINETKVWTPEKVNQLLKDDQFVRAASQVVQTSAPKSWSGSEEKWSTLTDGEKQEFVNMQNRMQQLENQNFINQKIQQDGMLKTKYANYASDIVDTTINKLTRNEMNATREDVWKVIDYENAVQRAYELGKKDGKLDSGQMLSLPNGVQTQPQGDRIEPIKGESDRDYFRRIVLSNAIKAKK